MAASDTTPVAGATAGKSTAETFSPRALLSFYAAKFRAEIALQFAYRGAIAIWLLSLVMTPLISLVVWTTVARENGGSAGGFTTGQYAAYFIAVMMVNNMTFIWHMWQMEWRVKNGFFSPVLLRPMHPIHNDVVENLTFKALTLIAMVPIAILLAVGFEADFGTGLWDALAFVPALIGAMAVRFICEWALGLAAFWITRTGTLNQLYGTLTMFLAGQIAPLSLFPESVRIVASVLPFRWMIAFPAEVMLGRVGGIDLLIGLGMQILWTTIALVAMHWFWARGVRRYSAVGA